MFLSLFHALSQEEELTLCPSDKSSEFWIKTNELPKIYDILCQTQTTRLTLDEAFVMRQMEKCFISRV